MVVLTSVIVIDWAVGKAMDLMLPQISNQGDTGKIYYSLNDVNIPVVIVGSSRASHHYVTQMIEDTLQIPAYNVAVDGRFFSHNCCVINSILDRYSPELIIWENGQEFLYDGIKDPVESLHPYYSKNQWAKSVINEERPWIEHVRLNSRLYQYNSLFRWILTRYIRRDSYVDNTEKGYEPSSPKSLRQALNLEPEVIAYTQLSETKVERFRAILKRAKEKGVRIIVVDSPMYKQRATNNISAQKMKEICEQYGTLFIDNSQLPFFLEHPELFNDNVHLNDNGAKLYTQIFLEQICNKITKTKE